jgi:hypothetical protein
MKRRNFTLGATAASFAAALGFFPRLFLSDALNDPSPRFFRMLSEEGREWLLEQPDETKMEIYHAFAKATYEEIRRKDARTRIITSDGQVHQMPDLPPYDEFIRSA